MVLSPVIRAQPAIEGMIAGRPPIPAAAWQIGLGCFPIVIIGLALETTHIEKVTPLGWWLLVYSTVIQFCIAYVSWFAALTRLPASVAALGAMAVRVMGVVASAVALGGAFGVIRFAAPVFSVTGVVPATRSCGGFGPSSYVIVRPINILYATGEFLGPAGSHHP